MVSVLSCNRNGCDSIMCWHYSEEYGYICSECRHELLNKEHPVSIQDFMDSNKKKVYSTDIWQAYVENVFKETI